MIECGSLQSAYEFCKRGLRKFPQDCNLQSIEKKIHEAAGRCLLRKGIYCDNSPRYDVNVYPELGLVRREIYDWNDHEPDRFSDESLDSLNQRLLEVAPKLAVRMVDMPILPTSVTGEE